jgi:ABC-type multidrug transport system fused ATPase/permease subunit
VRFEGVRFRYPSGRSDVLAGVDLELAAGTSTALVGVNGAGKSTLVSLLARLRDPTGGQITVDGTDVRALNPGRWQRAIALMPQDPGQWQKLALGRAMRAPDPLLVVLDEPTASLDAHAEHALFERYQAAADDAASAGTITLLVSHRFSTVRMADLIVYLEAGHITEAGTHEELLAANGRYAELFNLQAAAYH